MKISIVIPTLNSEKYIGQCLESIFMQEYPDLEIIIVDGNSTDRTREIVFNKGKHSGYDVRWVNHPANGEPDAINRGMKLATGNIVTYIDSDDMYFPDALFKLDEAFKDDDCQWLYGCAKIIDGKGNETRGFITRLKEPLQKRYSYNKLLCVDFIVQPTVFMRREFYQKVGEFNSSERLVFDYEYWLRAGKVSKPIFINDYIAYWRAHGENPSVVHMKQEAKDAFRIARFYNNYNVAISGIQLCTYLFTIAIYKMMSFRNK